MRYGYLGDCIYALVAMTSSKIIETNFVLMNKQDILNLICRMVTKEPIAVGESNTDKDSWKAYREAEKICDVTLNPILISLIEDNTLDIKKLKALYHAFIFNCYNLNLGWKTIFDTLPDNPNKKIVQGILLQVSNINITPKYRDWLVEDKKAVFKMLEYSRVENSWERDRAWRALGFVSVLKEKVEERALEALENYDDETYDENKFLEAGEILDVIAKIGSGKSLPVLKFTMERYRGKQWISVAAGTIGKIGKSKEEEYLIEQLAVQRNSWVKSIIAYQLTKFGSEKSIPAIIDKVKKLINKKREIDGYFMDDHWFELIDLLQFLKKYESSADIKKLFSWIASKKLDKLTPKELEWVEANISTK